MVCQDPRCVLLRLYCSHVSQGRKMCLVVLGSSKFDSLVRGVNNQLHYQVLQLKERCFFCYQHSGDRFFLYVHLCIRSLENNVFFFATIIGWIFYILDINLNKFAKRYLQFYGECG